MENKINKNPHLRANEIYFDSNVSLSLTVDNFGQNDKMRLNGLLCCHTQLLAPLEKRTQAFAYGWLYLDSICDEWAIGLHGMPEAFVYLTVFVHIEEPNEF